MYEEIIKKLCFSGKPRLQHCPKINLNHRVKTQPVTDGADATVYVRLLFIHSTVYISGPETRHTLYWCILYWICTVATSPTVIGLVIMRRFRLFL